MLRAWGPTWTVLGLLWVGPAHAAPEEAEPPGAAPPAADSDMDERAQRHWGSGMAYLEEGDYPRALDAFSKAYELSGRARILLAIAVTHERRGDLRSAIDTLDEYLRLAPTADNAASIAAHRDTLREKHDAELQKMQAAARSDDTPEAQPNDGGRVNGSTSLVPRHEAKSSQFATLQWTALGVGIASGVAAAVSGFMANHEERELASGCGATRSCTTQETQTGRTMMWISTGLTGVSVVGLGVGLWLALQDGKQSERAASRVGSDVSIDLDCSPDRLTSAVTWSF